MLSVAAGLSLLLAAQVPSPTKPAVGRVLDLAGEPVVGATVHLLHRPLPTCLDGPGELRVEVTTDERGLFRAAVAPGRDHSAWANWDGGATTIEEGVTDGCFVELRADPRASRHEVAIDGLDAWGPHGPLTWHFLVGTENVDFVTVEPAAGALRSPWLPGLSFRHVEARRPDGEVLIADRIELVTRGRIVLPPPVEFRVTATASDTGAPLPGAAVRLHLLNHWVTESGRFPFRDRFRSLWPLLGHTDADGELTAIVPQPAPDSTRFALIHCDDHRGAAVLVAGDTVAAELEPGPAPAVPVRVLGAPAVDGQAWVRWRVGFADASGRWRSGLPFHQLVPVANGRVQFPTDPAADRAIESIWLGLPDAARQRWPAAGLAAPPAFVELERGPTWSAGDDPTALLQILDRGGPPAARLPLLITAAGDRGKVHEIGRTRTDRRGRVRISIPETGCQVAALSEAGCAAILLDRTQAGRTIPIELPPRPVFRFRLLDANGAPLAGARVTLQRYALDREPTPDAARLASLPVGRPFTPILFGQVSRLGYRLPAARADAEGVAVLPGLPRHATCRIAVSDAAGLQRAGLDGGTLDVTLDPQQADAEIVLRLR